MSGKTKKKEKKHDCFCSGYEYFGAGTRRTKCLHACISRCGDWKYDQASPAATEADAERAGIPEGYSIKNWDPDEVPIILLGSVFDANSLGRWIFDWTVFHHGSPSPMVDMAGDLWLLLVKLAGKMKRGEECLHRIRTLDSRQMVEDFLVSGDRLWDTYKRILETCEQFMWPASKQKTTSYSSIGQSAGVEFVESMFGRDRELLTTESLMASIRLWNLRFDANCEDILRRPSLS